jgi:hypothetical protein
MTAATICSASRAAAWSATTTTAIAFGAAKCDAGEGRLLQNALGREEEMRKFVHWLAVICVPLLLGGCFVPEKFSANIVIHKDGSYTYTYDGTLVFVLAQAGKADLFDDEAVLREIAVGLRQFERVQKAEYLGKGRYAVSIERFAARGETSYFLNKEETSYFLGKEHEELKLFSIEPQPDGVILIRAWRPDAKVMRQLNEIGVKIDGKIDGALTVTVESGVTVLKHNAEAEPSLFGLVGGYKWRIKGPDADLYMSVKPAQ